MTKHHESRTKRRPNSPQSTTNRRAFCSRAAAVAALTAATGCLDGTGVGDSAESDDGSDETDGTDDSEGEDVEAIPAFPEISDPPDAVYVPTHREAMRMVDPLEAGEYTLAPMLSYPHPFWLVDGEETVFVEPDGSLGVHTMFTLWDEETGIVLPVDSGAEIRLERDGEQVGSPRSPWTMISQEMGFHFGDNVPLEEFGTYTVHVTIPPLEVTKTGEFEERFTESATASFEFDYDEAFLEEVVGGVEYLEEEYWGQRGALEPMDHASHEAHGDGHHEGDEHDGHHDDDDHAHEDDHAGHDDHDDHGHAHVPYSSLPEADDYPGTLLTDGEDDDAVSGDAHFVVTLLEAGSRFTDEDERYLLVSPRTPYNRVPLADMALGVTIERDGESVTDSSLPLEQTLDHEFDVHYGLPLEHEEIETGDSLTITIETPPQVARHQGYETAFLEMPPVELTVPELE